MRRFVVLSVAIALVTLAGFWGGRKLCMMMWPGSVNPQEQWYFALGLNAEQASALKHREAAFRKDTDPLCMRICKERLELLKLMRERQTSTEAVQQKIEEIGQLQVTLEKAIASHILEVKDALTHEQSQAYLDRIHQQLRDSIRQSGYGEILVP